MSGEGATVYQWWSCGVGGKFGDNFFSGQKQSKIPIWLRIEFVFKEPVWHLFSPWPCFGWTDTQTDSQTDRPNILSLCFAVVTNFINLVQFSCPLHSWPQGSTTVLRGSISSNHILTYLRYTEPFNLFLMWSNWASLFGQLKGTCP